MPNASRAQTSFLGGQWSPSAQGRFDDPAYNTALNVCSNGIPIQTGAWTRRPGTQHAGIARNGGSARVIKYDFNGASPYTIELSAGFARFRNGANLATTNDSVAISAISAANPAVVQTSSASGWSTGNQVFFTNLGTPDGQLYDRQFVLTVVDSTHFSLTDALTGVTLDGSLLATFSSGTVNRIQEVTTPYGGTSWSSVRFIQADTSGVTLSAIVPAQIVQVVPPSVVGPFQQFSMNPLVFVDGPYLDPFVNGVQAVPSALTGIINITLQFPTWSSTQAYAVGQFVTSSGVNYVSLINGNVNNTPASSPSDWQATSAGGAINGGQGFLPTDVGRLIRLFSEPALWLVGTTYAIGNIVAYNPTGAPGAATYWTSLTASNVGNIPGNDTTHWQLTPANAARWTWGQITGPSTQISGATGVAIGNMTGNGGIGNAFDGTNSQSASACAAFNNSLSVPANTSYSQSDDGYVGKNFTGGPQKIATATVYPSTDQNYLQQLPFFGNENNSFRISTLSNVTFNLRAKASSPSTPSDGTLLATTQVAYNSNAIVSLISNDQATSWNYVWIEVLANCSVQPLTEQGAGTVHLNLFVSQVIFTSPLGSNVGNAATVEILGPPLLYTSPVITWRLGLYSNTTGFPTCGTWHEGRLWLGGSVPNRFDGSVSNGLVGNTINFAPTGQDGTVADNNAIDYTLNAPDVSQIFWMLPDLQGIICGTQSGEWLVQATANNNILTPSSIQAHRVTKIGCAFVEPRRAEHTTLFVQKHGRMIAEYFPDVFSGKFTAPDVAKNAKTLTQTGIVELAWQQQLHPILWCRRGDGGLVGMTYRRDTLMTSQGPTFAGWHTHSLGSGRTVTSICDAGSPDGTLDSLAMVTVDKSNVSHVEVMTNIPEDGTPLTSAWFLDDAVTPAAYVVNEVTGLLTIYGLWHLNGQTVQALVNGFDAGDKSGRNVGPWSDFTVANGIITIPIDGSVNPNLTANNLGPFNTVLPIVVGFTYTSQGQPLRIAEQRESGAVNGPAFGKMIRAHQFAALLINTVGIFFGNALANKFHIARFKSDGGNPFAANQPYTDVYWDEIEDPYSLGRSHLTWQITRPLPATVAAISTYLQTQDR